MVHHETLEAIRARINPQATPWAERDSPPESSLRVHFHAPVTGKDGGALTLFDSRPAGCSLLLTACVWL